ncbi:MAG: AAA-like domain-containing protein, partial [Xanthomonadales bacterium]|nr:AAA-like domain-containing protein [Xanthomonadales bacterium]
RTAAKLEEAGVKTAIVDLSAIGTEITAHQWYLDVALSISEELNLSVDLLNWWQTQIASGSVKCFSNFLRDMVSQEIQSNVVVFIDEIDTTLNLNFADDFFAAIRAIYNARAREPIFNRLTFVLIGVATPSDLIQDEKRTPFNVGQPIALKDFTHSDAQVLQDGLKQIYSDQAEQIFDRVFYWTAGHPYLTQKLCIAITEDTKTSWEPSDVDLLVNRLFLSSKAAEKEDNLQFVQKNVTINSRTRSLLQLYEKVLTGQPPQNDDHDLLQNQLKLIGLVQSDQGVLGIRNQIYQHVFNDKWISENMPPPGWVRPVTITAPLVALALIIFFAPIYLNIPTPWNPVTQTVDTALIQAQTLEDSFLNTTSADVQMTNLAELIALGFSDKAEELFFEDLSLAEQIALFENVNIQAVGQERVTDVIDLIYSSEQASANIQVTILAKLFESEGLEEKANALLFDELSSKEQLDLFRDATSEIVSPKIIVIFKAIAHSAGSNIRIAALATLFQSNG